MISELKNCTPAVMEIANLFVKVSENSATTMSKMQFFIETFADKSL